MAEPHSADATSKPAAKKYVRAVGPRLRWLLAVVFVLVALLTANAVYLATVTLLDWIAGPGKSYQNYFYPWMVLMHLLLGLLLIVPFIVFGVLHLLAARKRRNRRAVKIGFALFTVSIVLLLSGVLLMRVGGFDLKQPLARAAVYWLHVACPLVAVWLYWLHRLAGPRIKWKLGGAYAGAVAVLILVMVVVQAQDPRKWSVAGSPDGVKYFEPSLARTADGNFIPERALMNDKYCLECHQDAYEGWFHSAHRFSSFNNPAYLATIAETRDVVLARDKDVKASRWCAGCHDPVPFFSGKFDDPDYDIINDPSAHAGITCSVCHSITNVNSTRGNADYTIEEPLHYPFAYSDNSFLKFVNRQLVKAKPEFHKKTMLKPLHKTAEFCSTCHKVHLPYALNHYKEFLRGQNHYDPFLLSGVSGHGARSFYYPPKAENNCNGCHLPLRQSDDFGAKDFDGTGELKIHDHQFPAANTGITYLKDFDAATQAHKDFLKDVMRVDIFGIKEGGRISDPLTAPLRPEVPQLTPGKTYLLETVIRTMKMGHLFTQGTVDSNEVWMDVTVRAGGDVIGRSGGMDARGEVDPWSHFVNVFMLDQDGNRIDRRNAQDIFVPLYNHQIPPGAAQVVHYKLHLPAEIDTPVTVEVKLKYRKFDKQYMDFIADFHRQRKLPLKDLVEGEPYVNKLPVITLAVDEITFPVAGSGVEPENPVRDIPPWQRWNDYGIGLFLAGKGRGEKGELLQAEQAFKKVRDARQYRGLLNLARVYNEESRSDDAVNVLNDLKKYDDTDGYPSWTAAWLTGVINRKQGNFEEAVENLTFVLDDNVNRPERTSRGFDFSLDYEVINELGGTLHDWAKQAQRMDRIDQRDELLRRAAARFKKTLTIDAENVDAHDNLYRIYRTLGDAEKAETHRELHERYRPDDQARGRAINEARKKYPAANAAAEVVVIYLLQRVGTPELPKAAQLDEPTTGTHE